MCTTVLLFLMILTYIKLLKRFKFLFLATHTLFRKWPAEAIGSSFPPSYHREERATRKHHAAVHDSTCYMSEPCRLHDFQHIRHAFWHVWTFWSCSLPCNSTCDGDHVELPMKMCLNHNFSTTEPIWMILLSTESSWLSGFKYTKLCVRYLNRFLQMSDKLLTQAWE